MEFNIYEVNISNHSKEEYKGTKEKYWLTLNDKNCLVKFNKYLDEKPEQDIRSWNVSEKIFSEISNYLGYECVKVDFIRDENGRFGIASYDYKQIEDMMISSGDDLFYHVFGRNPNKIGENISPNDYSYGNIVKILLHYDNKGTLLIKFNSIMLIDALFGEGDRHYENWGIYTNSDGNYELLPMYDNSSCLLHQLRDPENLKRFDKNNMGNYIKKSKCKVTIDGEKYSHFEFIDYLLENLPPRFKTFLIDDIKRIRKLSDEYIDDLLSKIPNEVCIDEHKNLISMYIKLRRDFLLMKVENL